MMTARSCIHCGRPLPPFHWWQWPGPPPFCLKDRETCWRLLLIRLGVKPENIDNKDLWDL